MQCAGRCVLEDCVRPSTSVGAARLVGVRVSFHSEAELMVAISPGPLCLRPEDPPAEAVRPAPRGLLHGADGAAHRSHQTAEAQRPHV